MTKTEIVKAISLEFGIGEQEIKDYCKLATGLKPQFLEDNIIRELALEAVDQFQEYVPIT